MDIKIKSRIWIEADSRVLLGEGRVRLIKAIISTGSLSKAAAAVRMSYKKAWMLIDSINKSSEKPVVVTTTGGKGGGGTQVTAYGKELIKAFDNIKKDCWTHLDGQAHKIEKL